jgi:hypothetical protein
MSAAWSSPTWSPSPWTCPWATSIRENRTSALDRADRNLPSRCPADNTLVDQLYAELLGAPGGPVAHELLPTRHGGLVAGTAGLTAGTSGTD